LQKPAWYTVEGHGVFTDLVNLLHPPYTIWHLSYVLMGIALSPMIYLDRSAAVLFSFFMGLGIGAHALDETMGNPLKTRLSKRGLYTIGVLSLAFATLIGAYYVVTLSAFLLPIVLVEVFFALTYNLESFNGKFHNAVVFSISWGILPFLAGYFVNTLSVSVGALLASLAVGILTYVQRTLSSQARLARRIYDSPIKCLKLENGREIPFSTSDLISPAEKSLKALTLTIFVLAFALICQRFL
jgi:hypothetical protein